MFECDVCQKKYATKSSLTRHAHNHLRSQNHVCAVCQVVFYRHDLLSRHMKIHDEPGNVGADQDFVAATSRDIGSGGRSRLRARTACDSCKSARIKCAGANPCDHCLKAGQTCSFDAGGSRLSTDARIQRQNSITTSASLSNLQPNSYTSADTSCTSSPEQVDLPFVSNSALTPAEQFEILDSQPFWTPPALSWPWLHESMFLQDSSSTLEWLSVANVPGFADMADPTQLSGQHFLDAAVADNTQTVTADFDTSMQPSTDLPNIPQQGYLPPPSAQSQLACVNMLVESALETDTPAGTLGVSLSAGHHVYFQSLSQEIQEAFHLRLPPADSCNDSHPGILDYFVDLYFDNFWILWPLFPKHAFDGTKLHPLLYLAMTSIGAMYGGKESSLYAAIMHEKLREVLGISFFESSESDAELLSLGQARVLTQAAALYFGQKRGFSYAQHIGSVLIAQARRMDLFTDPEQRRGDEGARLGSRHTDVWLRKWVAFESRKRLAFAIMRLEMYTSVLLGSRPLVSAEEFDWKLPCSRYLWQTKFDSDSAFISAIQQDAAIGGSPDMLFSDLIRIALDKDERFPQMDMLAQELLMMALQEYVWRACRESHSLPRLTRTLRTRFVEDDGFEGDNQSHVASPPPMKRQRIATSLDDHLERRSRSMHSLVSDRDQVTLALRRWQRASLQSSEAVSTLADRSCLMSCLLLYHLSFLRLHSDVEAMHSLSYCDAASMGKSRHLIDQAWAWSRTKNTEISVRHACSIFNLLHKEAWLPMQNRAHLNFLTMIGLYHAAVTVWAFAGTHEEESETEEWPLALVDRNDTTFSIVKANSPKLMGLFVSLFNQISPAWSVRSSFAAAARRLQTIAFPEPDGTT